MVLSYSWAGKDVRYLGIWEEGVHATKVRYSPYFELRSPANVFVVVNSCESNIIFKLQLGLV